MKKYDIMSVGELEQAKLVPRERRMAITIDFKENVKRGVRIVAEGKRLWID